MWEVITVGGQLTVYSMNIYGKLNLYLSNINVDYSVFFIRVEIFKIWF
jgi:hypothetical protein